MIHKIITTLIATLLITSIVGPVAGLAAAQSGAPGGMVGTPDGNVGPPDRASDRQPDHVDRPDSIPTDAGSWSVHSSRHAADLETTVGTLDGELALVFTDDVNHAGRQVAVDAGTLRDAVGKRPEIAYVAHSSGRTYEIPVAYENGYALLELEEFSSNTVTFHGEVTISGNPATDGAQYSYELADGSSVDNFSIDVTGSTAGAWSNESGSGIVPSTSTSIDVGGNTAPAGPSANGKPVLEVTGHKETGGTDYSGGGQYFDIWGYDGAMIESESAVVNPPAVITEITADVQSTGSDYDASQTSVDVYIQEGPPDSSPGNGNLVVSGWSPSAGTGTKTIDGFTYEPTQDNVTIEFVTTSSSTASNYAHARQSDGGASYSFRTLYSTATGGRSVAHAQNASGAPVNVTADADDASASANFGDFSDGQTKTAEFPVSTSASSISWGGAGTIDYTLRLEERTETEDPTIEVNGNTTSYTGVLADGSTTSLATDPAWIVDGENRVNVSLTAPSSGPTPEVGLDYRHEAEEPHSTTYEGETWSERYNVTRSFADDRAAASLTIPFASNQVVSIRTLEKRVDGGSWQTVAEGDRSLEGSELTVELGDVSAGQTISVRAVGTKVKVENGEISVLEPTMLGEPLNTKVALDSKNAGFAIYVNNTGKSGKLHYTHSESWSNPQAFARYRTDGSQAIRFPEATSGDVARVSTIDMGVAPSDGQADVRVLKDADEPEFQVRESTSADRIEFTWRGTTSGHSYQLYSLDAELERDTAEAQSPVTLLSPGVAERLKIYDLGMTSGGGGDGTGVVGPTASRSFGANAAFIIGAAVAGLVVLFLVSRRWGDSAISSSALFGTGAVVIVLVVLQILAPNVLADYLGRAIESAFPLVLLAVAALGIVWLRQRGDDTSIIIQGGNK